MFLLVIVIVTLLVILSIVLFFKQRSQEDEDVKATEIELEMDLDKLSLPHYLLEAGKNEWRLNEKDYYNPDSLLVYTLGFIFNNPIIYFDSSKLQMSNNRIRLNFLLETYTDNTLNNTEAISQLVQVLFSKRDKLENNLQEIYNLPTFEENLLSNNLADTLILILKT